MEVIFMAYANSQENPLPLLKREYDEVYKILTDNEVQDDFTIHRDNFLSISSLNDYLGKFAGEVSIFNYSGHAGDQQILLDDTLSNAEGLVDQLKSSVKSGSLKLVILNGCSTAGQVNKLLEIGVPVIIATSAPVSDQSAMEFAKRFYSNLFENKVSFQKAFDDAMGPAKSANGHDLNKMRHIKIDGLPGNEPLWGIYGKQVDIESNPFIRSSTRTVEWFPDFTMLNEFLFDVFNDAGNPETLTIKEKQKEAILLPNVTRDAIFNTIPFPIAINLKKLFDIEASRSEYDNEEEYRKKWLTQAGQLYQVTSEFMGLILISQLWETKLRSNDIEIEPQLQKSLKEFFYLNSEQRAVYDYIPLSRMIRVYLESISKSVEVRFFVEEQLVLKDMLVPRHAFAEACSFLLQLHKDCIDNKIKNNLSRLGRQAEQHLCNFFKELGFLYRYHLTSITQIDIMKYRHLPTKLAQYKHKIIKLMRPENSKHEDIQYFMPTFLDNWTVVLIKNKKERIRNAALKEIDIDGLDFLNLSPFVIDRLAYEENRDISSLMFFDRYWDMDDIYEFNDASRPMKSKDLFRVEKWNVKKAKKYELESIRLQFRAFREEVLGEHLS